MKNYTFIDLKDDFGFTFIWSNLVRNKVILVFSPQCYPYEPGHFDKENYLVISRGSTILLVYSVLCVQAISPPNERNFEIELLVQDVTDQFETEHGMEDFWREISSDPNLSEEFIEKYSSKINWYELSVHYPMTEQFIEKYCNKVNWFAVCRHQKLSEDFIEKHSDRVLWFGLHYSQKLSEKFKEKYMSKLENVL